MVASVDESHLSAPHQRSSINLINDYEKFLEIRKILDSNNRWIDNFQHGYFVHPDLNKEDKQ